MPPKKFHPEILTSDEYTDPVRFRIFFYLVMKARDRAGKFRGVTIKRGEVKTGRGDIARGTGFSEGVVRGKIKEMCDDGTITVRSEGVSGAKFGVITITNYNVYQCPDEPKKAPTPTEYAQKKERLRKVPYSDDFERWWKVCGTGSKSNAWIRWQLSEGTLPSADELIRAWIEYKDHCTRVERTLIDGQGWLNQRYFETKWGASEKTGTKKIHQYTERDRMKDWISDHVKFSEWHGISKEEYSQQVSVDLCDLDDNNFWSKYGVMKSTAREVKESY